MNRIYVFHIGSGQHKSQESFKSRERPFIAKDEYSRDLFSDAETQNKRESEKENEREREGGDSDH